MDVFKFGEKKVQKAEEETSPEELARREISGLTGHKWEEEKQTSYENYFDVFTDDDLNVNVSAEDDVIPRIEERILSSSEEAKLELGFL